MDVEGEIDRLYTVLPEDFVTARSELVKRLRAEGNREEAERVTKLRKPTIAAWAMNQLSRKEKRKLRGLLSAGERLREAHRRVFEGGRPAELNKAAEAEREAVRELTSSTADLLREAGESASEQVVKRIGETLHAAAVDAEVAELVARGRLLRETEASGFGFETLKPPAKARKR